ncbi:hypothetical protein [Blastococcus deserti]|uniref:Uncharacterized protein n=1 Tax=Blastococcus deserti TaxID=2259033 RepID=A0ABW4XAR3_9ACTN
MRSRSVAIALVAAVAGLTVSAARRRLAARRRPLATAPATTAPVTGASLTGAPRTTAPAAVVPARDAVVLPFAPRAAAAPVAERPAAPARCGDSGGRTKAGTPCAARATSQGRCHHHRVAA